MLQSDIDECKKILLEKRQKIFDNAKETLDSFNIKEQDRVADELDQAIQAFNESLAIRLQDRERRLYEKVEKALKKIDEGTFGICESCDEDIGIERLRARPVTTKCLRCKEEEERQERNYTKKTQKPFILNG